MELAQVIEQDGLTADILANHLRDKINAHALVDRKHNAAAPADAAISIADLLEKTVGYSNGNGS